MDKLNDACTEIGKRPVLCIESVWNNHEAVTLVLPDGTRLQVSASNLRCAIMNATNWR